MEANIPQLISTADCLSQVPNEVLIIILTNMPDLVTLHSFITAYPSSKDLYRATYKEILTGTIRQCGSLQIQKLVCIFISIRNRPGRAGIEDVDDYLDLHLEDEDTPLVVGHLPDPMSALQDIALVIQDIEYFENSFITSRLRELGTHSCSIHIEDPSTWTERQRIRRGFWRLQVLCEFFKLRVAGAIAASYEDPPDYTLSNI